MPPLLRVPWRQQALLNIPRTPPRPIPHPRPLLQPPHRAVPRRLQSTKTPPERPPSDVPSSPTPPSSSETAKKAERATAILTRASRWLPSGSRARRFLEPYAAGLRSAPFSHVAAFLVLHELTAVLPLFGLAYLFHRLDWAPTGWVLGPWAAAAEEGLRKYAGYFRRKGLFGFRKGGGEGEGEGEEVLEGQLKEEIERQRQRQRRGRGESGDAEEGGARRWLGMWRREKGDGAVEEAASGEEGRLDGETKTAAAWQKVKKAVTADNTKGYKIGIQVAAAYTITKMLLVPRIALSLWATPWLARGFVAARRFIWA
ncbi:hypothetical protein F4779DRAFT_134953 [Xylariaceae sp. FL0662B]|nr:hypothetical protein F4779DRAFT_134953 [Xylariaceae sp. FL0662B]